MPWFFAYGLGTDLEQMTADLGSWQRHERATLPDHIYAFTGYHPEFDGGTSTILSVPGGAVLGVAYLIEEEQLDALRAHGHGYVLRQNRARVGDHDVPVYTLEPETVGSPSAPSDGYVARVRRGLLQHYSEPVVDMYITRALRRSGGEDLSPTRTPTPESYTDEYGCHFRRLFPWSVTRQAPFGSAWAVVAPGSATTPHAHDEEETFIFLGGEGTMSVDGNEFPVRKGDTVYLEPFSAHTVRNTGREPLELLCVWWGAAPALVA